MEWQWLRSWVIDATVGELAIAYVLIMLTLVFAASWRVSRWR